MLMKWEDLEIGDKIKWREEAINALEHIYNKPSGYYIYYLDKILTIADIVIKDNKIIISYYRGNYGIRTITIGKNGKLLSGIFDGEIIEIVELIE